MPVGDCAFPVLVPELCLGPAAQISKLLFDPLAGKFVFYRPEHGTRIILHYVADQYAKSGDSAGQGGDKHAGNV